MRHYRATYRSVGFKDSLATVNQKIFKPVFKPLLEFPKSDSTGIHLSRYGMTESIKRAVKNLNIKIDGVNLSISNSQHLVKSLGFRGAVVDCSYPEYDLCDLKQPDSSV